MRLKHYSKRSKLNIRNQIAQEAARIIIEDGVLSYQAAKQKAISSYGISKTESRLLCNEDIDDAMRQYQLIHSATKEQQHRLSQQRRVALEAMEFLEQYSPRLTGPLLADVAGKYGIVIIHLFADAAENIIITLLDANIPFLEKSHEAISLTGKLESYSRLCLQVDGIQIDLLLFPSHYLRNKPKTKGILSQLATTKQIRTLIGCIKETNSTTQSGLRDALSVV